MNRNKISELLSSFLVYLFFVNLTLAWSIHYFRQPIVTWGALFVSLLLLAFPLIRWSAHLKRLLHAFQGALEGIRSGNWNAALPSSNTQEIWLTLANFHSARTFLKETVDELEGENEKLSQILSNLNEGLIVADPANRIVLVNGGATNFLKINSSELLGKSLDNLMDGELQLIVEALIRGEEKSLILFLKSLEKIILFRTFFCKNKYGNLIAKVAALYDITETKRLEEMRKAFVANASHELRSPAAGLQAILDAFQVGGLDNLSDREKFLKMMAREVTRLNAIIRDLLDLSELDREKEFTKNSLPLSELFHDWLSNYELQMREKEIKLVTDFPEPDLVIPAHAPDIEKLFRNLVENAMKYTLKGGQITVGLRREHNEVQGWVSDTGIGIPKQDQERIFERFYRVDKSRSRAQGGTGLGLSIAKHAVERHGGKIWVVSEENQGSIFYFTLPMTGSKENRHG